MKLIIDIPKKIEEYIKDYIPIGTGDNVFCYPDEIVRMIQNGTPILDNDTNGNSVIKIFCKGIVRISSRKNVSVEFNKNWWNAPYQKGGK